MCVPLPPGSWLPAPSEISEPPALPVASRMMPCGLSTTLSARRSYSGTRARDSSTTRAAFWGPPRHDVTPKCGRHRSVTYSAHRTRAWVLAYRSRRADRSRTCVWHISRPDMVRACRCHAEREVTCDKRNGAALLANATFLLMAPCLSGFIQGDYC